MAIFKLEWVTSKHNTKALEVKTMETLPRGVSMKDDYGIDNDGSRYIRGPKDSKETTIKIGKAAFEMQTITWFSKEKGALEWLKWLDHHITNDSACHKKMCLMKGTTLRRDT